MPHYVQERRLYMDGNQWCAVGLGFRDLTVDQAGFGDSQADAVAALSAATGDKFKVEDFVVGGYCRRCQEWWPEGESADGCEDPICPVL